MEGERERHTTLLTLKFEICFPLTNLAQSGEEEDSLALRRPNGLHDPDPFGMER